MLADILAAAAEGRFPAPDGGLTVVPQPSHRDAGVLAFTAHSVVFIDDDPAWVRATLSSIEADAFAASMNPRFLSALLDRTGRVTDTIDMMTVASWLPGDPPVDLKPDDDQIHPRVRRAHRHRDDVRVWSTDGGVLILGRGMAGRWETAVEVDPSAQGRGLGRALATAARHLIPPGEVVWSQQAAGHAQSIRTFQAAGFRPVGSEILMLPRPGEPV
jgi:GNAT superfamily N-acetyltransferase